jgi:hypothetical protein
MIPFSKEFASGPAACAARGIRTSAVPAWTRQAASGILQSAGTRRADDDAPPRDDRGGGGTLAAVFVRLDGSNSATAIHPSTTDARRRTPRSKRLAGRADRRDRDSLRKLTALGMKTGQ